MTKRVQIIGHEAEAANAFIGESREITLDVTNWEFRVHDGETPGGWKVLNRDQNDIRYQARSVELDGLLGWEPNERGILARQGPSNYDLIAITVDAENLTVVNGNGFNGNPFISLAPEIVSDHLWTGQHVFTQTVTAPTFVGNLTGNTTGTHTGPVIGNVTGNVTGNLTGNTAGKHTGGLDTRGATVEMDAGTIKQEWIDSDFQDSIDLNSTFIGQISMFHGDPADIPPNWALCDGTNSTPDLRDRFIIAEGIDFLANNTGGSTSHTHTIGIDSGGAHSHTGAAAGHSLSVSEMPAHKHANGVTDTGSGQVFSRGTTASPGSPHSIDDNGSSGTLEGWTETVGSGAPHSHGITIDSGGAHTHTGTASAAGHLPPYYVLAFVKRIL